MFNNRRITVELYEADVWGDIIHPGEIDLTERLAEVTRVERGCRVLDVASGKGESALFLSRKYGCHVIGVDLSYKMVNYARTKAASEGVQDKVFFLVSEAEALPFLEHSFDVILCECSFSLFTDKGRVAREFWRVLRRGGRVGIADFYIREKSEDVEMQWFFFPCINGAEKKKDYLRILSTAGFGDLFFEDHSNKLKELSLRLLFDFGSMENFLCRLPIKDRQERCMDGVLKDLKKAFQEGVLGYCILKGTKL